MLDSMELIRSFMLTPAGSGYESLMARNLAGVFRPHADLVHGDRAGNVIAKIAGAGGGRTTMLFAHMDQIGFVVSNITEKGYLRLVKNGSVPDGIVPGVPLTVRTVDGRYIPAAVATKSYHLMSEEEKGRVAPIPTLNVDIGAKSREEAERLGVLIGCSVVYEPQFRRLPGRLVCGTSIDNRGGCLGLALAAERLFAERPPGDVYIVGTTQEEHNLRGALAAANVIRPDVAICFDITMASDEPGLDAVVNNPIGSGPTINLYTYHGRGTLNGVIAHDGLVSLAHRTADELGMRVNRFAIRGVLTDATYVQHVDKGPATIDLSFPMKYAHSPCELCDVGDIEGMAALAAGMISRIGADFPLNRYEI